jgi:hypothetical protein
MEFKDLRERGSPMIGSDYFFSSSMIAPKFCGI